MQNAQMARLPKATANHESLFFTHFTKHQQAKKAS